MPQAPHIEHPFSGSELVRAIVIGMSDRLTVPFALAAGLSGIANSTAIVITGGLAEIAAGSTAMGLGGYLAAISDLAMVKVVSPGHIFSAVLFRLRSLVVSLQALPLAWPNEFPIEWGSV